MRLLFPSGEHAPIDLSNGKYYLGSGAGVQITLQGPGIVDRHCDLQINGDVGVITPSSAESSVLLNNTRLSRSAEFRAGDVIQLGEIKLRVVAIDKAAGASVPIVQKRHHESDADDGRTRIRQALPKFLLRGVSPSTAGKVFPLTGVTVIGRAPECDISIPSDEISRRHAELRVSQDGVMIEDLGSANGTFVNDRRVTRELLKHGDEIRLDTLRFQIVAPGKEMLQAQSPGGAPMIPGISQDASRETAAASGLSIAAWVLLLAVAIAILVAAMMFAGVV